MQELKRKLKWKIFDELDELKETMTKHINKLKPQLITSITGWDFFYFKRIICSKHLGN